MFLSSLAVSLVAGRICSRLLELTVLETGTGWSLSALTTTSSRTVGLASAPCAAAGLAPTAYLPCFTAATPPATGPPALA